MSPRLAAAGANEAPPLPVVQSVTPLGTVQQNPVINMRDNAQSTLFKGRSVWTFGDTDLSVPNAKGSYWDDNSLSWSDDLDASDGIRLEHDLADSSAVPREYLPYTPAEARYNYNHDQKHCTQTPCGAEFALWSAQLVADPARDRLLLFYPEVWRVSGRPDWRLVGSGIAVWTRAEGFTRPVENPGSPTPTLMWSDSEVSYIGGSLSVADTLYSYGCSPDWIVMHCRLARVPLAGALDKSQWRYYAGGDNWSADENGAVTVFDGGAAANSVFYVPYLGEYLAIYSQPFTDDVMYRVAEHPWGPWSEAGLLFTGLPGSQNNFDYSAVAHPEFSQGSGRVQYVTYVRTTGFLQQEIRLVRVVFDDP
ncbi:MAG TPA: DUF4185 domain-containing protein [Gammaproteobacteria bacterium]|nr:DUF4185 domain-containing protein [Gammaproteobacteria bacterium]